MSAKGDVRGGMSRLLHAVLDRLGLEVRLVRNVRAAYEKSRRERELDCWRILQSHRFPLILDIGANEGQFAEMARQLWSDTPIHCFEPLPDVSAELKRRTAGLAGITVHNIGLSDKAGAQAMHRSDFSPSSSLLPMTELHRSEWPQSAGQTQVEVRLERLDDWAAAHAAALSPGFLAKIDVQGFERAVIDGGAETLRLARFVVVEVSFDELYVGQPLFEHIDARMRELGFVYRGSVEQYFNRARDRILFADAIFENTKGFPPHD